MNRQEAEKTIIEYLKPVFGFALKRCRSIQDAEDLSQEIAARAFRALLVRDDIADVGRFIWTVAHNALSNYYRDTAKSMAGISLDEIAELMADSHSEPEADDKAEAIQRLQAEIAYLSRLQRKIVVAFYFENRRQADIARELNLPLGTVKWHLFEAKKELKRGMDMARKASELKFNPIRFHSYGINGSAGTKSPGEFFRSALSQNVCYCVRNRAKTMHQIADDLGVSPVYVESEVEFLEEYGFLQAQKDKYLANFIISEPDAELLALQDNMYSRAAELFANDLYDELIATGILADPDIRCGQADRNFILWSLIPYIAACSGRKLKGESISFEEVATLRPDGAYNIFHATVAADGIALPEESIYRKNWCGPMWSGNGRHILWQIDSEWSDRGESQGFQDAEEVKRILSLYEREHTERLSRDEYAWLAERGCVKTNGDDEGNFQPVWQIVVLAGKEIQDKLLAIGERIKVKYQADFEALKAPYAEAALKSVPAHLRKVKAYELQSVLYSDGLFLIHCITVLLKSGKLKKPAGSQRKSLTMMIINV